MTAPAFDLSKINVGELLSEVEKALPVLISAAEVLEKFDFFLPANVKATVDEAVKILTVLESIVSKL